MIFWAYCEYLKSRAAKLSNFSSHQTTHMLTRLLLRYENARMKNINNTVDEKRSEQDRRRGRESQGD